MLVAGMDMLSTHEMSRVLLLLWSLCKGEFLNFMTLKGALDLKAHS